MRSRQDSELQQTAAAWARAISRQGLGAPALLAVELLRPLGFLGSQALLMLSPLFAAGGRQRCLGIAALLEDPDFIGFLVEALQSGSERQSRSRPSS